MLIGDGTVALPASLDDANELTLPLDRGSPRCAVAVGTV
jgi:hypothetical protein